MRQPPSEFTRGPKPTREKLNALVRAVRENMLHPGLGLRIRETDRGLLLTLDDKILIAAGLANSGQFGRSSGNGPFGSGEGLTDFKPPNSDPTSPDPDPQPEPPDGVTPPGNEDTNPGDAYPPLAWATFSLPDAELDAAYSTSLFAVGGTGSYSYAITDGSLPPGLSLVGNLVSGTPTSLGSHSVEITVTSGDQSKPANFTMMVSATGSVKIVGASYIGASYWLEPATGSVTLSVVGGVPPYAVFFLNGPLANWYNGIFNGPNVSRPSSMGVFPTSSIFGEGITVTIAPNNAAASMLLAGVSISDTRRVFASPQGPRRWTMVAFDSTGASFSKTVTADFFWRTSKYAPASDGPDNSVSRPYPRWIDRNSEGDLPEIYTPFTGTLPFVT